ALFQADTRALAFDRQGIILDFDHDRLRLHPGQLGGKHVRLGVFADVHRRGPARVAVLYAGVLRDQGSKKSSKLPLGFRQLAPRIPMILLHVSSSRRHMRQKISRLRPLSREERTWSDM